MQYSTSQYVEEYKCNTTAAFSIIKNFKKGERYQESVGRLAVTGQITNAPSAPNKFEWVLSEATLTEQAGGDNSILHLEFTLKEDDESENTFVKDVTLSWRPYQTSVLAFCKNDYHEDKTSSDKRAPADQTCVSKHIDLYVKGPQKIELSSSNEVALGYTRKGPKPKIILPTTPEEYAQAEIERLKRELARKELEIEILKKKQYFEKLIYSQKSDKQNYT